MAALKPIMPPKPLPSPRKTYELPGPYSSVLRTPSAVAPPGVVSITVSLRPPAHVFRGEPMFRGRALAMMKSLPFWLVSWQPFSRRQIA